MDADPVDLRPRQRDKGVMNTDFAARLTRQPIAFDRESGKDAASAFADLAPELRGLIEGAAGCSPYLRGLMGREGDWLRAALAQPPETVLPAEMQALEDVPLEELGAALRRAKRRVALFAGLADLGGVWPLESVTGALSDLADRAADLSIRRLVADEIRRGKLPGATEADAATGAGMVALAMGKGGARELNYSSDIDLICLFDQDRYGEDWQEARQAFIRVTRKMAALISDVTSEGYVFRLDLRLRPDASVTPVCISMAAAEAYYEAQGRTWERAAYIKARAAAGDIAAGERFLKALTPFVWRRHLDFAAIQDAHDMRLRIRDHRGLHGPIRVEGHNIKLGAGGIREIEFFTQTRQLIAGGRDPTLRDRTTLGALAALAEKAWVPADTAAELSGLYRAHREIEHRLQMVGDAQTHLMPESAEGIARIAAMCGEADVARFRVDLKDRLTRTDTLTEGFFAPGAADDGPDLTEAQAQIVSGWNGYPCLRSERAQGIFRRVRPRLLGALLKGENADEALMALDGFLRGLPSGVQIFSLFDTNPQLVDLIVDICGTSPALAGYLARNAGVLDAVIGGSFWAAWPGTAHLISDLLARLHEVPDYERRLDLTRVWMKEWHFRIGVHHLRGLIDAFEAGKLYADLAEAVVAGLWPMVGAEFARRHGPAPGRGAAIVGMGSLGAGRLNAGSDLDLIVIYDAAGKDASDGPKPLATRAYFARLTQAMVTALTALTPQGRLYEVDMRLRPSGRQGPVAVSVEGFRSYQMDEAWTWEHLALTRARPLSGDPALLAEIEATRRDVLAAKAGGASVLADVSEMRGRLQAAKPPAGAWEAKNGAGRLMDIELLAQTCALRAADPARRVEQQLRAGVKRGFLSDSDERALLDAYRLCWRLQAGTRLLTDRVLKMDQIGAGGRAFLVRETGADSPDALSQTLETRVAAAAAVVDRALAEEPAC
jgi:[glutamine synthetase] adenylyltransferase / [glutamine synthetase]-adenylyl-L-tyrosine phosphorylase